MEYEKLIEEIASAIVADVFHNRHLQAPATRLVLVREDDVGDMKQNLGGMCKDALHRTVSDRLATALAAATKREALGKKDTQTAFAWVVEHAESEQSRPRYYDGIGWSDPGDNEAAIRFAREKDARFFANKLDWPNVHRVCEHGWDEQIAAALSPAKPTEE